MTRLDFIAQMERYWQKDLGAVRDIYLDKTRRFSESQLEVLFNAVVDECRFFPKVADIYKLARRFLLFDEQSGFASVNTKDCPICEGTGWEAVQPDLEKIREVYGPDATAERCARFMRVCECWSPRRSN